MNPQLPVPDYDARWKDLIKGLHRYFVAKFFPNLYPQIDFAKKVRFLDKEMQKLFADWNKKGPVRGDILMEFQLKKGGKQFILIHVEAQHGYDQSLPERMFVTFYRLRDKYPKVPLTAIALYTGDKVPSSPGVYEYKFEGTELVYKFPAFIVKDQDEAELLASDNPIDLAILAGMYVLQAKGDVDRAYLYKNNLARLCFQRGYNKQATSDLINFVSFLIALPEKRQKEYEEEVIKFIEMNTIPLIEQDPRNAKLVLHVILGKPLEDWAKERDRERDKREKEKMKKAILKAYQKLKLNEKEIADFFEIELKEVKAIIKKHKEGMKKKPEQNGQK
ncbi:MAG TPA: hypothetical protein ENJ95_10655 [Bacteroidetes bacterium]|nr:hypothetical protein [Bacteroidota bacterium]